MTLALSAALAVLWVVLAGLFVGVGGFVLGHADDFDEGWAAVHAAFWAGAATVTAGLLVWHLVLPVNGLPLAVLVVIGVLGLIRHRAWLSAALSSPRLFRFALPVLVAVIWIANHALNLGAYDDYNYEFQAVRWNHDFPIVPGLANLHGRLGFNQSHHLLGALLSVGPLAGRVNHVINGLFVSVLVAYAFTGLMTLAGRDTVARRSMRLRALVLAPLVGLVLFGEFGSMISTLKADAIVTCLVLVTGCFVVEFAEAVPGSNRYARAASAALLVCAMAVSVKLSATAFALIVGLGVAVKALVDARGVWSDVPRPVRVALATGGAVLALVGIRGVLLSGYPAYPSTVAGLPVDWRVSDAQALLDQTIITSMARNHLTYDATELARTVWIPDWAYHIALDGKFTVLFPALVAACAGLVFVLGPRRVAARTAPMAGPESGPSWPLVLLITASSIAIGIWLLFAPAPRFGTGPFWLLASCMVLVVIERARGRWTAIAAGAAVAATLLAWLFTKTPIASADRLQLVMTVGAAVVGLALVAYTGSSRGPAFAVLCAGLSVIEPVGRMTAALVHHRTSDAADVLWLVPDDYYTNGESVDSLVARQTHSGLTLYIPPRTHFETPLPNTRYFNPYLELRQPGKLAFGFRTRTPGSAGPGYVLDFMANHAGGRPVPEAHARR